MSIDHKGDPWSGTTYRGFAGGSSSEARAAPTPRRGPSRALLAGGVAGALAMGVAFGFLMRPQLIGSKPSPATPPRAAAQGSPRDATPDAAQVPIAMSASPAPEPLPRAPGKLQTLPPAMAAAARAQVQPPEVTAEPPAAAKTVETTITTSSAAEPAPVPRFHASFDCATARPGAEEVVCSDAGLAAADRQMARAYRRAMSAGVAPADLRQEQRDWVAIREDAARHSERAVADVYAQRIQELNEIADAAPDAVDGE